MIYVSVMGWYVQQPNYILMIDKVYVVLLDLFYAPVRIFRIYLTFSLG